MGARRRTAGGKSLTEASLFEKFIFKPDRSFIQMEMSHLGVQGKQSGSRLKVLESRKRVKKEIYIYKKGWWGEGRQVFEV